MSLTRNIKDALLTNPVMQRLYTMIKGIPPITADAISKEDIRKLVDRPDPVILEIGCNDGENTAWFLEVFERPVIYCFEPEPRAVARFRKRIGRPENVILTECALSGQEGEITFYQSTMDKDRGSTGDWDQSGSIKPPLGHLEKFPEISFDQTITVPTTTLDKFCADNGIDRVDFIWMDVQGAEADVISGGRSTLFGSTRYLYTEYALTEMFKGQLTLGELLKKLPAFKLLHRYPGDVLLVNSRLKAS